MNINPDRYTYRLSWSPEDNEHVATCVEFPSLSWLDANRNKAINGITKLVAEIIDDMEQNNEPIPAPISERQYSGKFNVRVLPSLHRKLAIHAAEQGVSLNRLVSDRLANH